jgi:peptidoglycan/xylan/chitin deacetylase (PgdA/CDA1 family)
MQTLQERGFKVTPLKSLAESIRQTQSLPSKTVVLTFDDGFKNFYRSAYPVLQELGFSATVFLVPGYVGKSSEWNRQLDGLPVLELVDWGEIREMSDDGIDFGAHTMTHPDFSKLSIDEIREEIITSKSNIRSHLGRKVRFFSYPYGILSRNIEDIVQKEFLAACSTDMGFASRKSDVHVLPRIDMYYFSDNDFFRFIGTSLFTFYVSFRSLLRSFRLLFG